MTDAEVLKLCKSLARRYKNHNQYDDLVSEGLLACYELRDTGSATDKKDYIGTARSAMRDYNNIKTKAVNVPVAGASRMASKALSGASEVNGLEGVANGTFLALMAAMSNSTELLSEDSAFTPDHAEAYEEKEYYIHVITVALMTLSATEWQIIKMRYIDGMTQDVVAEETGTNQKWVSRVEITALDKLRYKFCNNS
jgi:RNA polymerase sigma factor (sigma-70 family)